MTSPIRVIRQIVAPNGKHRPRRAVLLPDEPITPAAEPVQHVVLDETELERLLEDGEAEPIECAHCPCCNRTTAHAMQRNGSRRCWTCGTTTQGENQ